MQEPVVLDAVTASCMHMETPFLVSLHLWQASTWSAESTALRSYSLCSLVAGQKQTILPAQCSAAGTRRQGER